MSLLSDLLFEDVHRGLVGLQLLVLQEDPPPQLQRRRQVRVVAEVALEQEACHQTFPEHRLVGGARFETGRRQVRGTFC